MTKKQALQIWRSEILPGIRAVEKVRGHVDLPGRCEAWNNWTDSLCKSGQITPHQYETWTHPPENG